MNLGCGHHLIGDESKFLNFHKYNDHNIIVRTDNIRHHIEKEGMIIINTTATTKYAVCHVLGMCKNLFSISNNVDVGRYLLFVPYGVKFLEHIKKPKAYIIHIEVKELMIYIASLPVLIY